ncbi:hypothetical protein [Lacihabitans soyangensis]|uniref:Immunoglobulin subtype domain-containing protein n=1 Tax=Lacihabitans soyangensis TaxID=869394 RepID=A0AAE3KU21_9BACT|nr:hypothetical protein [Lacihabitans soyangensis]MCP9764409.1 hypothetical protein [Lacihabitans soyangensis]
MIKLFTILFIMASTVFTFLFEKKTTSSPQKKKFHRYNTDTSRVFYYSFSQEKVIDLKAKALPLKNEKLTVVKGTQVLLEAPIFHANALYLWEGPNGFRSYSQNVLLENVHTNQSGIYTVSVKKANGLVSGKIELTVVEKDF